MLVRIIYTSDIPKKRFVHIIGFGETLLGEGAYPQHGKQQQGRGKGQQVMEGKVGGDWRKGQAQQGGLDFCFY